MLLRQIYGDLVAVLPADKQTENKAHNLGGFLVDYAVLNGVFNYTVLYCSNCHIFFFHRLIMPLEKLFEKF